MLIVYGKMCCKDELLKRDFTMFCYGSSLFQFLYECIFIYFQTFCYTAYEFQRMELGLLCEAYCPHGLEGEFALFNKPWFIAKLSQRCCLILQLFAVISGIDIGMLFLIITVQPSAKSCVFTDRLLIGVKVHPCSLSPQAFQQLPIDQPVLGRDFRCSVSCDS